MDPQKLSSLDPKLRDAYQRVMGTPIPQPQTPPPPPMPAKDPNPSPTPEPQPQSPTPPPTMPQPQPSLPQSKPILTPEPAIPQQPATQASNFVQMNSEVSSAPSQNFAQPTPMAQVQTMAIKKKKGIMMPILFGIAGLTVIAVYTLFWAKIFNFKLPFLP